MYTIQRTLKTGKNQTYSTVEKQVEGNSCENSQTIHIKRCLHLLVVKKKKINTSLFSSDWQTFKSGDNYLSFTDRNVNATFLKSKLANS